jgi:hypothetical protein
MVIWDLKIGLRFGKVMRMGNVVLAVGRLRIEFLIGGKMNWN